MGLYHQLLTIPHHVGDLSQFLLTHISAVLKWVRNQVFIKHSIWIDTVRETGAIEKETKILYIQSHRKMVQSPI